MREAMASAEVGDDVYGEDPSVCRLQEYAAQLLGKEAALFVPSGTMANLLAFLSQTHPGETVILCEDAHPFQYEAANLAVFGGLLTRTIPDPLGKLSPEMIAGKICQEDDPHRSQTTIVSIENTTNRGGGACYTPEETAAIAALCRQHGMRLHCDGARLFNAAVALDADPAELARPCDSVSFCLSKALGAPVGSLLCTSHDVIARALRFRKMLGGGMRQAGILAAAGLYALQHHIDGLNGDHHRARSFRDALEAEGVTFSLPSPTNILYIETPNAPQTQARLAAADVLVLAVGEDRLRVVFHRDIDDAQTAQAIEIFTRVLTGREV